MKAVDKKELIAEFMKDVEYGSVIALVFTIGALLMDNQHRISRNRVAEILKVLSSTKEGLYYALEPFLHSSEKQIWQEYLVWNDGDRISAELPVLFPQSNLVPYIQKVTLMETDNKGRVFWQAFRRAMVA